MEILRSVILLITVASFSCGETSRYMFHSSTNRHHYVYLNASFTWNEGKTECETLGGNLVSILDDNQYECLLHHSISDNLSEYWIGLHRNCSDNVWCDDWRWFNGDDLNFTARADENFTLPSYNLYAYARTTPDGQSWFGTTKDITKPVLCEIIDNCNISTNCPNYKRCLTNSTGFESCSCFDGYSGENCSVITESSSNLCEVDRCFHGSCVNDNETLYCVCDRGWSGLNCSEDIDECTGNNVCFNSTCNNTRGSYVCECPDGYVGQNCRTSTAVNCQSDPCQNGAACIDDVVDSFSCQCSSGFMGRYCETDIDECASQSHSCQNGICINDVGSYSCDCTGTGYSGRYCDSNIDECVSDLCQNGVCAGGLGSYSCTCGIGYTGRNCESDIDECASQLHSCQNGACMNSLGSYSCQCNIGYTGRNCAADINECASQLHSCQNGTCMNSLGSYSCQCSIGYTGRYCATEINECASNPCQNGATCIDAVNSFSCQCRNGYTGLLCQQSVDECPLHPCQNGGICVDGVNSFSCDCASGFTGQYCESQINECASEPCQNGGTCMDLINSFLCHCADGSSGSRCQYEIDQCESNRCLNGATCIAGINLYSCQCRNGFTGSICETEINECSSNPCQNGATCTSDDEGQFICKCPTGYGGEYCQFDVTDCGIDTICTNGGHILLSSGSHSCLCDPEFDELSCQQASYVCVDDPEHSLTGSADDNPGFDPCQNPTCSYRHIIETRRNDRFPEIDLKHFSPCKNGGICSNHNNGSFYCLCPNGLTGKRCQCDVDECLSHPCGHGECLNMIGSYECRCHSSYLGKHCDIKKQNDNNDNSVLVGIVTGSVAMVIIAVLIAALIVQHYRFKRQRRNNQYSEADTSPASLLGSFSQTIDSRNYESVSDHSVHIAMDKNYTVQYLKPQCCAQSVSSGFST